MERKSAIAAKTVDTNTARGWGHHNHHEEKNERLMFVSGAFDSEGERAPESSPQQAKHKNLSTFLSQNRYDIHREEKHGNTDTEHEKTGTGQMSVVGSASRRTSQRTYNQQSTIQDENGRGRGRVKVSSVDRSMVQATTCTYATTSICPGTMKGQRSKVKGQSQAKVQRPTKEVAVCGCELEGNKENVRNQ